MVRFAECKQKIRLRTIRLTTDHRSLITEFKTNRHRHLRDFAGRLQFAGFLVDAKDDDVIGILIGDEQKFPIGRDREIARGSHEEHQ